MITLLTDQNPLTDHRVSTILQRANPLRKGLLDGQSRNTKFRAIGNLLEEGVAELHTFDGGEEVRREAKSARGANQLAQLMQWVIAGGHSGDWEEKRLRCAKLFYFLN